MAFHSRVKQDQRPNLTTLKEENEHTTDMQH